MRRLSVDALRGLVIVLMALDHTQFFWSAQGLPNDGLGGYVPAYASSFHQFTRFLSHICAPTFLFLAGMMMPGKSDRRHLATRAALLIVLQFTLENIAWWPKAYLEHGYNYFGILSCIGSSILIILALSPLGPNFILALSFAAFTGAQLVSLQLPAEGATLQALSVIFYIPSLSPGFPMTSLFPVLHWFGFVGLGYWFGDRVRGSELAVYTNPFMYSGLLLMTAAIAVRGFNGFGNRIHWQAPALDSDFFILSKYPPSLVFVLFMLGAMFVLFSIAIRFESRLNSRLARPLVTFGQTSLFFYLTHLFLYGSVAYYLDRNVGANIYLTWAAWLLGLVPMYFLCRAFREAKLRRPASVLRLI